MIAEVLLISVFAGAGGALTYAYRVHRREQEAYLEELKAERAERASRFRSALTQEMRRGRPSEFRFADFAARCEVPREEADLVAEDLYLRFFHRVIADGVITEEERKKLDLMARGLEIDPGRVEGIEAQAKESAYRAAVAEVLADGRVDASEAAELEALRRGLGLNQRRAFQASASTSRDAYLALFREVVRDGVITPQEREELHRCRQALAISDSEAAGIVREEALELFRERFTSVIQDGVVTEDEERDLLWLREETGLSEGDVAPYWEQLRRVKALASYREGNLPSVPTRHLLEGGETCHWQGPCTHVYATAKSSKVASGDLLVTNSRVLFQSPSKNVSFAPAKVMDIQCYSDGLRLKVSTRQGTGAYLVQDPEELEAILFGLVRKHKFLLAENYSSAKSRHIPDDVRRAVWDRDGGRCVRCRSTIHLEYDHIIPHAKGGANTANNVQLLCRKCNLLKSDRI